MKKILAIVAAVLFILQTGQVSAQKTDYEKYGKIAISVIQSDYTGEPVTDYQYLGRKNIAQGVVEDSFQFNVIENGKRLKPIVKIRHNLRNNKLVDIRVEEPGQQTPRMN
ncbi:DUF3889 domain-containing protein [Peribacillus deserti]|uniref:DUF3889 domain-containing protein n=1 Tax=Peribacillus deserti TaxID=673318 RepID=A0A2N5LZG1_9BACI|nr:DUF3889 domain-containing protein [Peribacillus deserti]PLT27509.1 hypothetical protein CUU66_23500 [Peribacillus deserti]